MDKAIRMMVGPTVIPSRVLNAMNEETFSHRTDQYSNIQQRVTENLQKIFKTKNEVFVLTSSGTGAMESVIQNCFSPGDQVVVPIIGNFGAQYATMAEVYGLNVTRVTFELGETADLDRVMEKVNEDTKGVFLVHNESSTGVYNDVEAFGQALKDTNAIFVVDSVSGVGGLEIRMDDWNIDVVLTASQKALMGPAGLSFVAISDKAWGHVEKSKLPKYYFDYKHAREFNKKNQTLTTPAVYTVIAIDEALKMILEEGVDNVYKRHNENTRILVDGIKELGLSIFPKDEKFASPTLTAVYVPGKSKYIVKELAKRNIIVNGGLGEIAEDVFRVGIMGHVSKDDVAAFLDALKEILEEMD